MDLGPDLWSGLSSELIERVLSFIPAPDLCKLRSVCKEWNELLCKPSFHDLCEQNRKEKAYLLVTRHLDYGEFNEIDPAFEKSISLLDLDARRWYFLKCDEFPADERTVHGRTVQLLSMDEGLVCKLISANIDVALAISDSITGTRKEWMETPLFSHLDAALPILVTTVDASTRSYKVFLISNFEENMSSMYVYESSNHDEVWRELKTPPRALGKGPATSAVYFRGILYVISRRIPVQKLSLLKYNLRDDAWEVVKVNIPRKKRCHPQLVVSCNRLFLMLWMGKPEQSCLQKFRLSFQVREILVAENSSRMVVQIPKTHLQQMFGEEDTDFDIACAVPFVNSSGTCTSIVLMSALSGNLISYNPVNGSVILLPAHPEAKRLVGEKDFDSPATFYQGKYTNLSLRNLSSQFLR